MTVREALEAMPDGKARAYTTILTVMQVMERKGLVAHKKEGTKNVYRPLARKGPVVGTLVKNLVKNVFGGSPSSAMQFLLDEAEVSLDDLEVIQRLLDQKRDEQGRQ